MATNDKSQLRSVIDTVGLDVVAATSSEGPDNQLRWTELAIFHRPGERRQFVSQSVGRTKVRGETDFIRQRVGKTVEEVCRLFDNSRLGDEIVTQAQAWLDQHPGEAGVAPPEIQFDGAGGLRGALLWLYPAAVKDAPDVHLAKLFQHDWGVPVRTVTHALKQESDGEGLPSWCKAFIGVLQHFDRDAFHACRRI